MFSFVRFVINYLIHCLIYKMPLFLFAYVYGGRLRWINHLAAQDTWNKEHQQNFLDGQQH